MHSARLAFGLLLLGVSIGSVTVGASQFRRRVLPHWYGAPAILASAILSVSTVIIVCEAIGSFAFRLAPVSISLIAAGGALFLLARRPGAAPRNRPDDAARDQPLRRVEVVIGSGVVAAVIGIWVKESVPSWRVGMGQLDTLWYHLPLAARFVQDGSVAHIHYFDADNVTAFYPANSELLHALGILFLRSDVLSPVLNLGWLALALLAGWCIGRPFGVGLASLTGVAAVASTPTLLSTQPGQGSSDMAAIALVLSAVALLLTAFAKSDAHDPGAGDAHPTPGPEARHRPRPAGVDVGPAAIFAALATGLALGTKYTVVVPVVVLTGTFVVAFRPTRRARATCGALLAVAATSGFWYVRNLVAVGNPLPQVNVGLHTLASRTPTSSIVAYVSHYGSPAVSRAFRSGFGRASWGFLLLSLIGAAVALAQRSWLLKAQGILVAAGVAGYFLMPQILSLPGAPGLFLEANLRYLIPAVAVGVALVPTAPALRGSWPKPALVAGLVGLLIVTLTSPRLGTAATIDNLARLVALAAVGAVLLTALFTANREWEVGTSKLRLAAAPIALAVIVGGAMLGNAYAKDRYRACCADFFGATVPGHDQVWIRMQGQRHQRIAVVGTIQQYPLYGADLTNFVQYVGQRLPGGGVTGFGSCSQWRQALDAGHYNYVVINTQASLLVPHAPKLTWTSTDPAVSLVLRDGPRLLFRIHGKLSPGKCTA